jgi:hypothetical protein
MEQGERGVAHGETLVRVQGRAQPFVAAGRQRQEVIDALDVGVGRR